MYTWQILKGTHVLAHTDTHVQTQVSTHSNIQTQTHGPICAHIKMMVHTNAGPFMHDNTYKCEYAQEYTFIRIHTHRHKKVCARYVTTHMYTHL